MAGLRTYLSHPPNFGSLKITKHTLCRLRFYLLCFYTVNASQHILIEVRLFVGFRLLIQLHQSLQFYGNDYGC